MKPYKLPKGYLEFSVFAKHLEQIQMVTPKPIDPIGMPNKVVQNLAYMYGNWAKGYPVYCVRQQMLDDMLSTDVGENIALFSEINLAIPAYVLFLPKNQVKSPSAEGFIDYIVVNHEPIDLPEHKYLISWCGNDSADKLFFGYRRIRRDGTLQNSAFWTDDEQQQQGSLTLRNIVLQSVLLLQFYPEEMQQQITVMPGKERGFGKNHHESQFQLPRWLGVESARHSKGESRGTGSSKSPHFRRGHWRCQPCGEGRKDTKITWVRPSWVAGEVRR